MAGQDKLTIKFDLLMESPVKARYPVEIKLNTSGVIQSVTNKTPNVSLTTGVANDDVKPIDIKPDPNALGGKNRPIGIIVGYAGSSVATSNFAVQYHEAPPLTKDKVAQGDTDSSGTAPPKDPKLPVQKPDGSSAGSGQQGNVTISLNEQKVEPTVIVTETATRLDINNIQVSSGAAGNGTNVAQLDYTKTIECPTTAPTRRGFQILGPEGWRTFDQDERLLLAMTTDSQPLISTLKDISSRILNTQSPDSQNR